MTKKKCEEMPAFWTIYRGQYENEWLEEPYYLTQTMLSFQNNAVVMDGSFNTYYVFNKILFVYLKACCNISPEH